MNMVPRSAHAVTSSGYNEAVNPRHVEAFVNRDWAAVHDSKAAYWAERFQRDGWQPAWTAADALWADIRRVQPDFPSVADRDRDLADHLRLRASLDRVGRVFTRR